MCFVAHFVVVRVARSTSRSSVNGLEGPNSSFYSKPYVTGGYGSDVTGSYESDIAYSLLTIGH